jgi:hypothetical protein
MKDTQNKIIISQKAFTIHIYGLHHYKGKISKYFSEYITFSINFNVGSLVGMTNIQMIFDLVPRSWYPLDRRLTGHQEPVWTMQRREKSSPCWELNPSHPAHRPSLYQLSSTLRN